MLSVEFGTICDRDLDSDKSRQKGVRT